MCCRHVYCPPARCCHTNSVCFYPSSVSTLSVLHNQILGHLGGGNSSSQKCPLHPCIPFVRNRGRVEDYSKAARGTCIRFSIDWELKQATLLKRFSQSGTKSWWFFFSLIVFEFCRNSAFSSRVCKTAKVKPGQAHCAGYAPDTEPG